MTASPEQISMRVRSWYRLHDSEQGHGMLPLDPNDAHEWNRKGWGIFWTVNAFEGARRIANLKHILAWAVDIDNGEKPEQRRRLERAPLLPSGIVESKNGYHAYWLARGPASAESYREIVTRMVARFDGDPNARDVARVLRVPGFLHLKDPEAPFRIKWAYGPFRERQYTETMMLEAFPRVASEPTQEYRAQRPIGTGVGFWERIYNLDCIEGLRRLSGSGYVSGEKFTFQPVRQTGKHNILVDGKGTSCWVDTEGRIGSSDNGGPTLYNWIRWYGHSPGECVRIIKEIFPGIEDEQ